jgi:hypothetical protein
MAGIRESQATLTLEYQAEPGVVAAACQDALNKVGRVRSVERQTGVITGKIADGWFYNGADVTLQIRRKSGGAEVLIQGTSGEAVLGGGSAQKSLSKLIEALANDSRLSGRSSLGW